MSRITRRGALWGSLVAWLTAWLPGRSKATATTTLEDEAAKPTLVTPPLKRKRKRKGEPRVLPIRPPHYTIFPWPVPPQEQWDEATAEEQYALISDMAAWMLSELNQPEYTGTVNCRSVAQLWKEYRLLVINQPEYTGTVDCRSFVANTLEPFPYLASCCQARFSGLQTHYPDLRRLRTDVDDVHFPAIRQDNPYRVPSLSCMQFTFGSPEDCQSILQTFPVIQLHGWSWPDQQVSVSSNFYCGFRSQRSELATLIREVLFPKEHPRIREMLNIVTAWTWQNPRGHSWRRSRGDENVPVCGNCFPAGGES
jgi:hypothetical protein